MKITLNELRKIVKKIIKEEEEKTPTEKINELNAELNNQFKIFRGHFRGGERSLVPNVQKLEKYYSNFDKKAYPKDYNLLDSSLKGLIQLLEKYNEITNKPSITGLKMLLPQFIKIVIDTNEYLAEIFEISENTELKGYTRPIQFNIGGMRQAANSMIDLLSRVEALSPQQQNNTVKPQNNVPQQQSNISQSNINSQQVTDNLKASNNNLQGLFFEFEKAYKLNKNKYIDDIISEKQFSAVISNYLQLMSGLASQMQNSINAPVNENSIKLTIIDDNFDNYVDSLKKYVNSIDEAISSGKINIIGESIDGIMRISRVFQEDLNTFSR